MLKKDKEKQNILFSPESTSNLKKNPFSEVYWEEIIFVKKI